MGLLSATLTVPPPFVPNSTGTRLGPEAEMLYEHMSEAYGGQ
ncbi:hypothetical protein ACWD3J_34435 [Streptomyces sp. NPDC002755]